MKIEDLKSRGHASSSLDLHHNRIKELVSCDRYGHILDEPAECPIEQILPEDREIKLLQPEQSKAEKFN